MRLDPLLALTLSPVLVSAIASAADTPAIPAVLQCGSTGSATGSYEAGKYASKPPAPLSFLIDDIDLDGQAVRIVTGPSGVSGNPRIVRAISANHFLEVANEGFLNLTTIYDKDPKTGLYAAIHCRHRGVLGQPVFAQYTGFRHAQ